MAACPPLEDIAAFLDGTLSPEERARITEHLARCESCYEVFAGAVHFQEEESSAEDTGGRSVLPFPLSGEKDRAPRRIPRWLPLAASIVLTVGLGFTAWQLFAVPKITLAEVIEPLEGRPGISADLYESEVERGDPEDSAPLFPSAPSVMAGVHALDLRLSVQSENVEATAKHLQDLGNELQNSFVPAEVVNRYYDESATMTTAADLARFRPELPTWEQELQSYFPDSAPFQFGLWAEAGRLAAVTQTREFFERRANRRFLSYAQKVLPEELGDELWTFVREDLQAIERIWDKGEFSPQDYQTLAGHFQKIIEQIDEYEDDTTFDGNASGQSALPGEPPPFEG